MDERENGVLDLSLRKRDSVGDEVLTISDDNSSNNRSNNSSSPDSNSPSTSNDNSSNGSPIPPPSKKHRDYFPEDQQRQSSSPPTTDSGSDDVEPLYASGDLEESSSNYKSRIIPIQKTFNGTTMFLHDEALWRAFAKYGTEMIINRGGRRMFPHIILSMIGLNPESLYSIILEIVPADERRYKFINNAWVAMGMADPGPDVQPVIHPDSPNTGAFWMHNRVSFSKVRLTNNKESSCRESVDACILLLSMHKYKVVIKIRPIDRKPASIEKVFVFDESAFVAVTAYQNNNITQLKIQNNPFAKAFRDAHHTSPLATSTTSPRRREKAPRAKALGGDPPHYHRHYGRHPPSMGHREREHRERDRERNWSYQASMPPNRMLFPPMPMSMGFLERMYRSAMDVERNGMNSLQYLPWAALSREYQTHLWMNKYSQAMPMPAFHPLSGVMPDMSSMGMSMAQEDLSQDDEDEDIREAMVMCKKRLDEMNNSGS